MSPDPPLIGITCGSAFQQPKSPDLYERSVKNAGGWSWFVTTGLDPVETARRCAGILIPGGRDISPLRYGEEQVCALNPEEEKRTEFEIALLSEIIRLRKPVLGICYGMQLLNVYLGGTLHQDIFCGMPKTGDHRQGKHGIAIKRNPFLEEGLFDVNSSHHQAVKRTGRDLMTFAFAADGIIEGFYAGGYPFLVGVQWHPERLEGKLSVELFSAFIRACNAG